MEIPENEKQKRHTKQNTLDVEANAFENNKTASAMTFTMFNYTFAMQLAI